jgi:hypothetical protein
MVSIITQDKYNSIIQFPMAKDNQGTWVVITPKKEFRSLYNIDGKMVENTFKSIIDCTKWFHKIREEAPSSVKITLSCSGSELFRNIEALMKVYEIKHMKKYEETLNASKVKAIMIAVPLDRNRDLDFNPRELKSREEMQS